MAKIKWKSKKEIEELRNNKKSDGKTIEVNGSIALEGRIRILEEAVQELLESRSLISHSK